MIQIINPDQIALLTKKKESRLNPKCKNEGCENRRQNGSSRCKECSDKHKKI